jgi:F-type H+-transporting ATPase subunit delta
MADFSTVARPYARAVFDHADAEGNLNGWSKALAVAAVIASDQAAREYLSRPSLRATERAEFIAELCGSIDDGNLLATGSGRNLLGLLSENHRLNALAEISAQFDQLKADRENRVTVTVVTATEVGPEQVANMTAALKRKLGRDVELELAVDSTLIGGGVIRAKDMVIDGSLQSRLKRLASTLAD